MFEIVRGRGFFSSDSCLTYLGADEFCTSLGFAGGYRTRLHTLVMYLLQGQPGHSCSLKPECVASVTMKYLRLLTSTEHPVYLGNEANQFCFSFSLFLVV